MQVVTVINHKGGVGKTTLTANLGAGLAARGKKVLLLDLDSQASLTLSFLDHNVWVDKVAPNRTIKHWFDTLGSADVSGGMSTLVARPGKVNDALTHSAGYLDLIAAHRDLGDVEAALTGRLYVSPADFALVHHCLRDGLRGEDMREYDVALIDCAPHFGVISRNAIAASDFLLIPAKPDYLSTNGVHSLGQKIMAFVEEFNQRRNGFREISRPSASVVFTMVQGYAGRPIADHRKYLNQDHGLAAFTHMISDSKAVYGPAPSRGVPVILGGTGRSQTRELRNVLNELVIQLEGIPA
ncbi:ParA family protein [Pseudonocardia xinjiangensis]|uniref:ParA family protein n=1 Tax=Pseudonocardia xinjiangensis TaxID=75289 RepID=UPI003D8A95DA